MSAWRSEGALSQRRGLHRSSDGLPSHARGALPPESGFVEQVMQVLRRHLSEQTCRAILNACSAAAKVDVARLQPGHAGMLRAAAERSLNLFRVPESQKVECLGELHAAAQAALSSAGGEVAIPIDCEEDIFRARAAVKDACARIGFGNTAQTKVVTALSELARNIVQYAGMGRITIRTFVLPSLGVEVVASDDGPGIADLAQILNPSFRSRTGMGVGLRGARSLMDFFDVQSAPGLGTTVTLRKFVVMEGRYR